MLIALTAAPATTALSWSVTLPIKVTGDCEWAEATSSVSSSKPARHQIMTFIALRQGSGQPFEIDFVDGRAGVRGIELAALRGGGENAAVDASEQHLARRQLAV